MLSVGNVSTPTFPSWTNCSSSDVEGGGMVAKSAVPEAYASSPGSSLVSHVTDTLPA